MPEKKPSIKAKNISFLGILDAKRPSSNVVYANNSAQSGCIYGLITKCKTNLNNIMINYAAHIIVANYHNTAASL